MNKETGFALPILLFSAVLVAAVLAHSFRLWIEARERYLSESARIRFESVTIEKRKAVLFAKKDSSVWETPPLLWSSNETAAENKYLNVLLLKKQARPRLSPLPDWHYLSNNSVSPCVQYENSEIRGSLANIKTCLRLRTLRAPLQYIAANAKLGRLRPLLSGRDESVLAIAGRVDIETLEISDAKGTLSIVALGDIKIRKIISPVISQAQLLMSSTTGRIEVGEMNASFKSCRTPPAGTSVSLGLEASSGLFLGSEALRGNVFGCPLPHQGPLWPKIALLGSPA